MGFNFDFPVKVVSGVNCIEKSASLLKLGKHAFIVCGKRGAKASGALDDVQKALNSLGIGFTVFDRSVENPPLLLCYEAGALCREAGADLVIGIGGGSAIDAAKAVAVFAKNPSIEPDDIFDLSKRENGQYPLIAVTTAAGTGSEANGFSVMSLPNGEQKRSFLCDFPKIAFLDPRYLRSLSASMTVSCALDAFAHAFESHLSPKSTPVSRMLSAYAGRLIWAILSKKIDGFTCDDNVDLQNAACAAGLAISVTGTGFTHPLGYSLTMLNGVPHGAACAVFCSEYISYNLKTDTGSALINEFCNAIGSSAAELSTTIPKLSGVDIKLSDEQISHYVALVSNAKNYSNSPYVLTDKDKTDIYKKLFS